jgi:hypothetical protein
MKIIKVISRIVLISIMLVQPFNLNAQNCVCALCNVPCNSPASAHTNPNCPVYKNRVANSGSKTISSSKSLETEIMGAIFQSMLSSSNINSAQSAKEKQKLEREELERKNQLAIKQAKLKKYNDSIAQTQYDKMMKDYKKLDGSKDLSYKGLDNEKKWAASIKFNCKITSFKGDVRVVKSDGSIRKLSENQSVDLSPGDWINTGKDSRLKLHYEFENDRKDIIIGQNSLVNIVTNEEGTQVPELIHGNTYVTNSIVEDMSAGTQEELISMENKLKGLQAYYKSKFQIRTPCSALAILGITLSVSQDSLSGTTLIVTKGVVDLTGLLMEQKITIEAGYKGIVTPSGEIIGPIKIEESEIEKWWKE